MTKIEPLHVIVRFGSDIPGDVQAKALFEFEKLLRELSPHQWIEVFKEIMGDDSKLRNLMTVEERGKL